MGPFDIQSPGPEQVLTPAGSFCHRGCCNRFCTILAFFFVLIYCGALLLGGIPILHLMALSICPTMIIMGAFFKRYQRSATKRQMAYTFWEAIAWMFPLLTLVGFVDLGINYIAAPSAVATCEVPAAAASLWVDNLQSIVACGEVGQKCLEAKETIHGIMYRSLMQSDGGLPKAIWVALDDQISEKVLKEIGAINPSMAQCGGLRIAPSLGGTFMMLTTIEQSDGQDSKRRTEISTKAELLEASVTNPSNHTVQLTFSYRSNTVLHAFLKSYFRAAGLEEILKYVAVRRVVFKDHVVDCGSVIVYGLAGAAGFATFENIEYVAQAGLGAAYLRMFLAIPLHCVTGLIIGMNLSYRKFLGKNYRMLTALGVPVLVHGTYDFAVFVNDVMPIGNVLTAFLTLVAACIYCRNEWLKMDNVCVVDVRAMEKAGQVSKPACCWSQCDCCPCSWASQDTLLQAQDAPQPAVATGASSGGSFTETARRSFTEVFPPTPTCQTVEVKCPNCERQVRRHIRFPSNCPYCGTDVPTSLSA